VNRTVGPPSCGAAGFGLVGSGTVAALLRIDPLDPAWVTTWQRG
jgi:hypothetical protein